MILSELIAAAVDIVLRIGTAIIIWFIARWLIRYAVRFTRRWLEQRQIEATVTKYVYTALDLALTVVLVIGLLGFFGLPTTTLAALVAGAGVAIGAALSGLLAHFAAGLFLLVLRPFKVGDSISGGGVTGTVIEIGLFNTAINTIDNVFTVVGNNKLLTNNIENFSVNPYRRVLLPVQVANAVDHDQAIALLVERATQISKVLSDPKPRASIVEIRPNGPIIGLTAFCKHQDYEQVVADGNRTIRDVIQEAGYPPP